MPKKKTRNRPSDLSRISVAMIAIGGGNLMILYYDGGGTIV